jgi:biopolymer transport protein ExbB/TolQ
MNAVLATGLLDAFYVADLQGKVIVVILCLGSALTWTVMLTKWQQLRQTRRSGEEFIAKFRQHRDPLQLFINNVEMRDCALYNIYRMAAEEVSSQFSDNSRPSRSDGRYKPLGGVGDGGPMLALADTEVGTAPGVVVNLSTVRGALGRAIDTEVMKLESQVSILSTAVQGGPFLGLLGSAWGVMSVFGSMGVEGSVRLSKVAPGISAALLATVVGLLVAVPSLFAYNWLAARVRHETMIMESFADEFVSAVEHNYVTS